MMAFLLTNNSNKYDKKIADTYNIEDTMSTKSVKASEIAGGGRGEGVRENQTLEFERVLVGVLGGGSEPTTNVKTRHNRCIPDYFSRRRKRRTCKLFTNRTSPSNNKVTIRQRKSEKWATSLSRLPTDECTAILRLHGFNAPDDY